MSGLRESQKASRRKNILDAAKRLFLERGYVATTIEAIAETAAVSAVTVYNHYRTKGGVLLAVVGQSDSLLIEKIRALIDDPPNDLLDAVMAFSETISSHAYAYLNKPIWRHVIATSVIEGGSEFGRGYEKLDDALARLLAELLETFKRDGALAADFAHKPPAMFSTTSIMRGSSSLCPTTPQRLRISMAPSIRTWCLP